MVFISPLFLKLDTPDLLDSSMYPNNFFNLEFLKLAFPTIDEPPYLPVRSTFLRPKIIWTKNSSPPFEIGNYVLYLCEFARNWIACRYKVKYKLIFTKKRSICVYLLSIDPNKKMTVLIVSIASFIFMDVGLEMLGVLNTIIIFIVCLHNSIRRLCAS
jgi:hypothetical protein